MSFSNAAYQQSCLGEGCKCHVTTDIQYETFQMTQDMCTQEFNTIHSTVSILSIYER